MHLFPLPASDAGLPGGFRYPWSCSRIVPAEQCWNKIIQSLENPRLTCPKQRSNCFKGNADLPDLLAKREAAHRECLSTGVWVGPRVTLNNMERR